MLSYLLQNFYISLEMYLIPFREFNFFEPKMHLFLNATASLTGLPLSSLLLSSMDD